jgi:hypothetical protein
MMDTPTMTNHRWIVHSGHGRPSWATVLRRELIEAYRRGTMDAARCLGTYRLQGDPAMLPPEAVLYLATRVVAEQAPGAAEWRERCSHPWTRDVLRDHGARHLASLIGADAERTEGLVEAGRRFFFPGP